MLDIADKLANHRTEIVPKATMTSYRVKIESATPIEYDLYNEWELVPMDIEDWDSNKWG